MYIWTYAHMCSRPLGKLQITIVRFLSLIVARDVGGPPVTCRRHGGTTVTTIFRVRRSAFGLSPSHLLDLGIFSNLVCLWREWLQRAPWNQGNQLDHLRNQSAGGSKSPWRLHLTGFLDAVRKWRVFCYRPWGLWGLWDHMGSMGSMGSMGPIATFRGGHVSGAMESHSRPHCPHPNRTPMGCNILQEPLAPYLQGASEKSWLSCSTFS